MGLETRMHAHAWAFPSIISIDANICFMLQAVHVNFGNTEYIYKSFISFWMSRHDETT